MCVCKWLNTYYIFVYCTPPLNSVPTVGHAPPLYGDSTKVHRIPNLLQHKEFKFMTQGMRYMLYRITPSTEHPTENEL